MACSRFVCYFSKLVVDISAPLPPPTVTVLTESTSTSSVTLQWLYQTSATYVESWVISYLDNNGIHVNQTFLRPATATIIEAVVNGLVAGFKYDMSVQAVVQAVQSSAVSTPAVTSKKYYQAFLCPHHIVGGVGI